MIEKNDTSNKILISKNNISDGEMNNSSENEFETYSFIDNVDDDCLLHIFSYLSLYDIISTQKVCQRWKQLCQRPWKKVESFRCVRDHWSLQTKFFGRKIIEGRNMEVLAEFLRHCGQFIKYYSVFDYRNSEKINYFLFVTVVKLCRNVVNACIEVLSVPGMPFTQFCSMAINWKNLEVLSVPIDNARLENELCRLLNNNRKIKSISVNVRLKSNFIPGRFLEYLSENTIETINIRIYSDTQISMTPMKLLSIALKKFINLQSFEYRFPRYIDDAIAKAIGKTNTLTYLRLVSAQFESPSSINYFANLVNLKKLYLCDISNLTDDVLINILSNCSQLELLDISDCNNITNRGIASIAQLEKLTYLRISDLECVTDESINNLPNFLEILIYDSHNSRKFVDSSAVIGLIRRSKNLQYLKYKYGNITPVIIEAAFEITNERQNGCLILDVSKLNIPDSQLPRTPFLSYSVQYKDMSPRLRNLISRHTII